MLGLAVLALGWGLVDAKSDIKEEIGRCNTAIETSRADAEKLTREVQMAAEGVRRAQLIEEIEREKLARALAEAGEIDAQNKAESALAAIRQEAKRNEQDCGNSRPDTEFWNSLRLRDKEAGS